MGVSVKDKILFQCDYNEGAHPRILERLVSTNLEQTPGYGEDVYCQRAAEKIRKACGDDSLAVHFLVGGTQANMTVISAALRPHQGVLCAETGHINVHETGAVESCGHKVLALPSADGKVTAGQVRKACREHRESESFEHMVQPGMVYVSNPTELGTIYSADELRELYGACQEFGLFLFLDGARLGYGLAAPDNSLSLQTVARYTDVFTVGGTKVGALFGEAVVIRAEALQRDFRYAIKQRGGMLAKGRLLGLQFDELFTDNLYFELSARAIAFAERIRAAIDQKGWTYLVENRTNQIFPIVPDEALKKLDERFCYSYDHRVEDGHSAVRFCTSWATSEENVDELIGAIQSL